MPKKFTFRFAALERMRELIEKDPHGLLSVVQLAALPGATAVYDGGYVEVGSRRIRLRGWR